ncbi:MAG TPA: LysR family transcriptional regulator [Ideonella sp.]|nr:LysR family transcriptional regulator [Ideonella sp.]
MDRLKALAIFKAVAEHGSFARAATALDLSPAAVTRTLQELESLLAVRLLQRTTRRVALTPVGEDVLARAQSLLASYDELSSMSSLCGAEPAGKVRLSAPAWLARHFLGGALAAYLASCPKVSLELKLRAGEAELLEEDADLSLCLAADLKPSLIARKLGQANVGLYASPAYLARKGEPSHPGQLPAHDGLTGGTARADPVWRFSAASGRAREQVAVKAVLNANQPEALLAAAVHGAGLALLPDFLAEEALASGQLRRLLPGWQAEPLSLHLVYASRKHQPLSVRRLMEALTEAFQQVEGCDPAAAVPPVTLARSATLAAPLPFARFSALPPRPLAAHASRAPQLMAA